MVTRTELATSQIEKSESINTPTSLAPMQSLLDIDLHQFKSVLNSYTDKLVVPNLFPLSIGADHSPPEQPARTGKTDASKEASKNLYGEFSDPIKAITADACIQPSGIGNCYFVAALASLANTQPEKIKDMIKVNDDGTYTVKFPGASEAVTVSKPTAAEIEQDGGVNKNGVWSLVMQKAYGKYCGGGKNDLDGSDGGSAFSAGVRILSDKGVDYAGIGYMLPLMSWNSMDETLRGAIRPGDKKDAIPVTASTAKSPFSDKTTDGFVRGHVYSVLDYKHNDNDIKQSIVTVRNPWGGKDAVQKITLKQFNDNFSQLSMPSR